jgi:hypothetical protein
MSYSWNMSRAVFICSIRFCRRDGALVSSTLPLTRIGRVVDLQHANGWIQSKQAVQTTAIERVSIDDSYFSGLHSEASRSAVFSHSELRLNYLYDFVRLRCVEGLSFSCLCSSSCRKRTRQARTSSTQSTYLRPTL